MSKHRKHSRFHRTALASLISLTIGTEAYASFVRDDIDYQYFRDFAENKGQFTVGASNIEIFDKNGNSVGVMLKDLPMPDFSSVSINGIATLISPQYITSVQHNSGYNTINFGGSTLNPDAHHFTYKLANRNNYPWQKETMQQHEDYHVPRLHKLVTEVAPIDYIKEGIRANTYNDRERYPLFLRLGSGGQVVRDAQGNDTSLAGAYQFLTGGNTMTTVNRFLHYLEAEEKDKISAVQTNTFGPMTMVTNAGDSGSPVFVYDTKQQKWITIAVLRGGNKTNWNIFILQKQEWIDPKQQEGIGANITNTVANGTFTWTSDNVNRSTLTNPNDVNAPLTIALADPSLPYSQTPPSYPALDHGKTLIFNGEDSKLHLTNNIDQGAGALYFNNNATVTGETANTTWLGAGVSVAEGKNVVWQVHNPDGDRLSKIGAGTLEVKGTGKNLGSISVGDGTVILAQQADADGNKQAFSEVGIVSGRATVVLNDAHQVNPDKIYFGYRGGRLDVNGNDIAFSYIQNMDEGAQLVNHHTTATSEIRIGSRRPTFDYTKIAWVYGKPVMERIFNYKQDGKTYYVALKEGGASSNPFPTGGESNDNWLYLATDDIQAAAQAFVNKENAKQSPYTAFNGFLGEHDPTRVNGALNITYDPANTVARSADDIVWETTGKTGKGIYQHTVDGVTYYYRLNVQGNATASYPTGESSDANWISLGSNRTQAIQTYLNQEQATDAFHHQQVADNGIFMLSGGSNLNGTLAVQSGTMLLSGRPVPHAYDYLNKKDVIVDDEWINRNYVAQQFTVADNATLLIGRNVANVQGNITLGNNSTAHLGFVRGETPECIRSDHTGNVSCTLNAQLSEEVYTSLPTTQIVANTTIGEHSTLMLGKSELFGQMMAGNTSNVTLKANSTWHATGHSQLPSLNLQDNAVLNLTNNSQLTTQLQSNQAQSRLDLQAQSRLTLLGNSQVGTVHLNDGSRITLNQGFDNKTANQFNTLTINGNLTGSGQFDYLTDLEHNRGDQVIVNGIATGNHILAVRNTGSEPGNESLTLMKLNHAEQENHQVSATLTDGLGNAHVDLGAYRYELIKNNQGFVLHKQLREIWQKGTGVTAPALPIGELPPLVTAKGDSVKAEPLPVGELPPLVTAKGDSVKAEPLPVGELPPLVTAKGDSVKAEPLPVGELPPLVTAKGDSVKAEPLPVGELPPLVTAKGDSVKAEPLPVGELPPLVTAKGDSVKAEPLPVGELPPLVTAKGDSVKAEPLPVGELPPLVTAKGDSVKAEPLPVGELPPLVTAKGDSVKAEPLPAGELPPLVTAKGDSVKAEPLPIGELPPLVTAKGDSVKAEPLPVGELPPLVTAKGDSVKAEPLPVGELPPLVTAKGDSVKAEPLPVGELPPLVTAKGDSVKAEPLPVGELPPLVTAKGDSVKAEPLPIGELPPLVTAKGDGIKAEPLPIGELPPLVTAKGDSVKAEPLPAGELPPLETAKGESVTAEPLPAFDGYVYKVLSESTSLPTATLPQSYYISRYTNTALSDISSEAHHVLRIGHGLNHRLAGDELTGIWASADHYRSTHQSDLYREYQKDETISRIGTGVELETHQGTLTVGGAWTHSAVQNQYDDGIEDKADVNMMSLYSKFNFENDAFVTVDVGYGQSNHRITSDGEKTTFDRELASAGVSVGKTLGNRVINIRPTVGVRYDYLADTAYQLNHANVNIEDSHVVSYHAGLELEKEIPLNNGLTITPSVSSRYVDATQHNQTQVQINGHQFNQEYGRYHEHELGLSVGNSAWTASIRANYAEGNEMERQTSAGVALNYRW